MDHETRCSTCLLRGALNTARTVATVTFVVVVVTVHAVTVTPLLAVSLEQWGKLQNNHVSYIRLMQLPSQKEPAMNRQRM